MDLFEHHLPTLLSIAGSDTSGGAGIQADIKAATLCHVHTLVAVTAITAQSTSGITDIMITPPDLLRAQLEASVADVMPDAVKIGMIGSMESLETVARFLSQLPEKTPVIIDPVLTSTSGKDLSANRNDIIEGYLNLLLPKATVATPNLIEAATFLNVSAAPHNPDTAVRLLNLFGCDALVLKGGHAEGNRIIDLFVEKDSDGDAFYASAEHPRIDCGNLHGTGCAFSSFMAARMALGDSPVEAFRFASEALEQRILLSTGYKFGNAGNGPLNLVY
jgi:hydroxymethylpyrimidine/phosphomethylpyrimidine kinase